VHPRSESTEDIQDARRGDLPQTRQRKRGLDEDKDVGAKTKSGGNDEEAEEEEVTRCICGELEYPGMHIIPGDSRNRRDPKSGVKDVRDALSSAPLPELAPEDAGGLFIQCDTCKVWQHGGCVGIMDEAMSPEEYFCEQCRADLHIIAVGANEYVRSEIVYSPLKSSRVRDALRHYRKLTADGVQTKILPLPPCLRGSVTQDVT